MEEQVGALWHKLITRAADASHAEAAVRLEDVRKPLGLFFRALGGDAGLQLEVADTRVVRYRRNWLQRIAGTGLKADAIGIDQRALKLPARISCFQSAQLNRTLFYWLAALAAHRQRILNPAQDLWINRNQLATLNALIAYPGLIGKYQQLVDAHLDQRPLPDSLPTAERAVELAIRSALLEPGSITRMPRSRSEPFPVPLWLYADDEQELAADGGIDERQTADQPRSKDDRELDDMGRRKAARVNKPKENRGLVTIRMENIFTWGEFINLDRGEEDEDDAKRAEAVARDLDKLAISEQRATSGLRLKFDLDLPSGMQDDEVLSDGILLPEWDWKQQTLVPDQCRVIEMLPREVEECALPATLRPTARKLKNQFQHLMPARSWLRNQLDGQEFDLESYLRFSAERQAGLAVDTEHFYRDLKHNRRDLSCLLLADLSLSTDTWVSDQQRVVDVIRDSLWLFAESLSAVGDSFSILGFSSRRRDPIRVHQLKRFDETYNAKIRGRIGQIKPGFYTRLGAAIRYASGQLSPQVSSQRLLLILTDGKPNDLDQYEGRYGIEDTRQAVLEARQLGLHPFCVTIDHKGHDYLPHLFGNRGFIVIRNPLKMPSQLPRLYAQLTHSG